MKCIIFKEENQTLPLLETTVTHLPRVGEYIIIRDMPYVVTQVLHDYDRHYIRILVKYENLDY